MVKIESTLLHCLATTSTTKSAVVLADTMKLKPTVQTIYVCFASLLGAYIGSQISHAATPVKIGAIYDVEILPLGNNVTANWTCTQQSAVAMKALSSGTWEQLPEIYSCDPRPPREAVCNVDLAFRWVWDQDVCGASHFGKEEVHAMVANMSIATFGDSHARRMFSFLGDSLSGVSNGVPSKFHHDARGNVLGVNMETHWFITIPPLTAAIANMTQLGILPDIGVISIGSWYPWLPVPLSNFTADLLLLESALADASEASPTTSWFLMTIPERVTGRGVTSTWAKNNRFWNTEIALLNDKLRNSTALQPRGSVWLLDAHDISKDCLTWCSQDGDHVNVLVNELYFQIMWNHIKLSL